MWQGACMAGSVCCRGVAGRLCMAGGLGCAWQGAGGVRGRGACMAGEIATAAHGTHPIGMNSCYENENV